MKTKDINTRKKPIIEIDKSLDFYNNISLFPEKVKKANEMLKNVGLPKFDRKGKKSLELTVLVNKIIIE